MSPDRPAHRVFAALYDPVTEGVERRVFREHRERLAADLDGRVLDLGAGTGRMFPAFAGASAPGVSVTAVEPDPHMRRRAQRRAGAVGLDVAFVDATAGALPFADGAFDGVVLGLVLCTVPEPEATLAEVARVLAPGGEVRFLEHVHGDGWLGRLQSAVAPAWRAVAGGCHLDRATGERLRTADGLEVVEMERLSLPTYPATPYVMGTLRRSADE